jgi:hypothetical protein
MNAVLRLCFEHLPSFKRERGGLYAVYVPLHSYIYATRMRYVHRRGRHASPRRGLDTRCQWCGADTAR